MDAESSKRLPPEMVEKLFGLYHNTMLAAAYEYLHDRHKAEDVVQEVYERLSKYKLEIDNPYSVKTKCLIKVMVRNAALTYREKESRLTTTPFDDTTYREKDYIDPEKHFFEKSGYRRIMDIIDKMDPGIRDVLKLKYGLSMKTDEIAKALGISYALTRYRIQRGRKLLREALAREQAELEEQAVREEAAKEQRKAAKEELERKKEKMIIQLNESDR